jgi:hypothetical protein
MRTLLPLTLVTSLSSIGLMRAEPPIQNLTVSKVVSIATAGSKLRDFQANEGSLWALLQSVDGGFSVSQSDWNGVARTRIEAPKGVRPLAIAATSQGVAILQLREKQLALATHTSSGALLSEISLPCGSGEGLISFDGLPVTVCVDGTLTVQAGADSRTYRSWAKPGSLARMLSPSRVAIVDQATGGLIINDLASSGVWSPREAASEIEGSVSYYQKAAAAAEAAKVAPLAKGLVVMDAAVANSSIYLLVYPFHPKDGFKIVRYSAQGELTGRYRCVIPADHGAQSPVKIQVVGNTIAVATTAGNVFQMAGAMK